MLWKYEQTNTIRNVQPTQPRMYRANHFVEFMNKFRKFGKSFIMKQIDADINCIRLIENWI